jgi:hypothetical protein
MDTEAMRRLLSSHKARLASVSWRMEMVMVRAGVVMEEEATELAIR